MDPSLMTAEEIERRGRVVIEPCYVCHHNRQAHVLLGVALFEVHGQRFDREIEDACIACTCLEFTSPPEEPRHYLGDGHEDDDDPEHEAAVEAQHNAFLERTADHPLVRENIARQLEPQTDACCSYEKPHVGEHPLGVHWVRGHDEPQ